MKRLSIAALLGSMLLLPVPQALLAQERDEERDRAAAERAAEEQERAAEEQERAAEAQEQAARALERAAEAQERVVRIQRIGSGAYLGVSLRDVSGDDVSRLRLGGEYGALVETVRDGSPASEAGLQAGDLITAWNGERVQSVGMLTRLLRETPAGRQVSLGVLRDGREMSIDVELGERSEAPHALAYALGPGLRAELEEVRERLRESGAELRASREKMRLSEEERIEVREKLRAARDRMRECMIEVETLEEGEGGTRRIVIARGGRGRLGVALQDLTDQLSEYFGVAADEGALVASVREGSPAAAAGLAAGDVIVAVGGTSVAGPGDVARAVRNAEAGPLEVSLVRRGERRTLTVTLPEGTADDCGDLLDDLRLAPEGGPHSFGWHSEDRVMRMRPPGLPPAAPPPPERTI